MTAPVRTVTSMVRLAGGDQKVVPVKTQAEIPKGKIDECMKEIRATVVSAPVRVGDVLIENVAKTGISVVATANIG